MGEEFKERLMDIARKGEIVRYERSFFLADPRERRRRLNWVILLSVELAEVERHTIFSTSLARSDIEAVIEGDWRALADAEKYYSFVNEHEDVRAPYAQIYSNFRTLLACCHAESTKTSASA